MKRKLRTVAVGGTFDELHKGHRSLLLKAFEIGDRVIIGLSSDEFVKTMKKSHAVALYKDRLEKLKAFLKKQGLLERAEIFPLRDAYGITLSESPLGGLVVSKETEETAVDINCKREQAGLPQLEIISVDMILSEDSEPISTTRIRHGQVNHEGRLLKKCRK